MAALVFLACTVTALLCSILLFRGHRRNRMPLLLWSALCFACLAIDNFLLFLDRILLPTRDFSFTTRVMALVGVALLLYGMIWKRE